MALQLVSDSDILRMRSQDTFFWHLAKYFFSR